MDTFLSEAANDVFSEDIGEIDSEQETAESREQDESEENQPEENESEEDEPEEDNISDDGDERLSVHRVVLTEEMLVDNPQRSLLSLVGNSADHINDQADETVEPEASESQTELPVDHALMAELLDRITDDVIRHLPILIKTSLEQHLNDLIQGEPSSDSTDQTEE